MSDYMFMLESHLSPEQNRAVATVEAAAVEAAMPLFLSGGAMRDMGGGFPIRDLDFTVEGNGLKLAKAIAQSGAGARVATADENRRCAEMIFPGGVTASISAAVQVRYGKPGSKPQAEPATIHEDLRGRDFTVNAIALSLSRASRGLLLDPTNGQGDLERRELRTVSNYSLYDDPARILRLLRLKVRLGFEIEPRTQQQYANVREAKLEEKIPARTLLHELRRMADEPNPGELLELLAREDLLRLFSPALTEEKLNAPGFARLHKGRALLPFGVPTPVNNLALFLFLLTEKLTPRERTEMMERLGMEAEDVQESQKLEGRARKLEQALKSARLNKASLVYQALREAPGEQVLFLLMRSNERLVLDRIRNYLQKYLPAAHEVTDKDPALAGVDPQSPKFRKAKDQVIFAKLDARVRKAPPVEPEPPPPPPGPQRGPGAPMRGPGPRSAPAASPRAPGAPPPRPAPPAVPRPAPPPAPRPAGVPQPPGVGAQAAPVKVAPSAKPQPPPASKPTPAVAVKAAAPPVKRAAPQTAKTRAAKSAKKTVPARAHARAKKAAPAKKTAPAKKPAARKK